MATDTNTIAQQLSNASLPPGIIQWLAKFKILSGVPFKYLVPDERMLPPESIRFFYLDEDWIDALVDGALSIGRVYSKNGNSLSTIVDMAHHRNLHNHANGGLTNHRERQLSMPQTPVAPLDFPAISGFMLRSSVVSGWKGLDFMAYEKGHSPYDYQQCQISSASDVQQMTNLRLEPLSNTVLIGLYIGKIYELVINQPPEGIHFGFYETGLPNTNSVKKTFRVPSGTSQWDCPSSWDAETYQNQAIEGVFTDLERRVISPSSLSKQMATQLSNLPVYDGNGNKVPNQTVNKAPGYVQNNQKDHLLSSDFGLEMVQGVGLVSFINYPQQSKCGTS